MCAQLSHIYKTESIGNFVSAHIFKVLRIDKCAHMRYAVVVANGALDNRGYQMLSIKMNKTNFVEFWQQVEPVAKGSVSNVVNAIDGSSQEAIVVSWQIYSGAPVSPEKQNAVFLRRCEKIAQGTGRKVENFQQVLGDNHQCELTL